MSPRLFDIDDIFGGNTFNFQTPDLGSFSTMIQSEKRINRVK